MIEDYFTKQVTIRRVTLDEYKVRTVSDAIYPCRIEATSKSVRGGNGEYIQCMYEIFLSPDVDVQPKDKVIFNMPVTGEPSREWAIRDIFLAEGFSDNHLEVLV